MATAEKLNHRLITRKDLEVEWVPIGELKQHPENPRAADPDNIVPSLKAHGQFRALLLSQDGFLLAGNHTYQGALALREDPKYSRWRKEKTVPEGEDRIAGSLVAESLASLAVHRLPLMHDSPQAIEILLADNRASDFSRYDDGQLAKLLIRLQQHGGELALSAAAWEPTDVVKFMERIEASGFLGDIAGGDEINKLMQGAATNTGEERAFSLPVTKAERDEIMDHLNHIKESYKAPTMTHALLIALRIVATHKAKSKR